MGAREEPYIDLIPNPNQLYSSWYHVSVSLKVVLGHAMWIACGQKRVEDTLCIIV